MASLFKRGAAWAIQFDDPDGERRTLGLGRLPATAARTIAAHVEHLAASAIAKTAPPPETGRWTAEIGDALRDKLAGVGLVAPRHRTTLGEFAEHYRGTRPDWGAGMRAQFGLGVKDATTFFGAARRLEAITRADGDAFRAYLSTRVALATARKRMRLVKHLLRAAVRAGLIAENPLADQRTHCGGNRERMKYIDAATVSAVADELVGETKLIFLLARYAGLRVPSEVHALRWSQVDFGRDVLRVYAPKTKTTRTVPLLPPVRGVLLVAFNAAPDGAELVIQHQSPLAVIRRYVEAAITRAGLTAWPKLMQQLRASFATDCVRTLPANAAAAILGHSAKVAAEHYWMTDDSDMERAAQALRNIAESPRITSPDGAPEGAQVVNGKELCGTAVNSSMGADGFEPS